MGNHLKPYFTPKSPRRDFEIHFFSKSRFAEDGGKKMVIRVVETKALWNLILFYPKIQNRFITQIGHQIIIFMKFTNSGRSTGEYEIACFKCKEF